MKILLLDIETSPIISYTWGLFDQNVGLNQVKKDWHLLSWSAKWLNKNAIMYQDQRNEKDISNDERIVRSMWKLLDAADIVITQNGKSFDIKKLNARFLLHGMQPPSSFRQIDTLRLARKHFAMTSNKLEYLSNKLCTKYKKLKVKKFPGFDLWAECLKGNMEAWTEMERYNKYDVLALEELYKKLIPWDSKINFALYSQDFSPECTCGSTGFVKNGYSYTNAGKFLRFKCRKCGAETRAKENLVPKDKRKGLRPST